MDREEWLGKKVFYRKASSRRAITFPVENVSTEISRGTISSHPVSRHKNLCYSLFIKVYIFILGDDDCLVKAYDKVYIWGYGAQLGVDTGSGRFFHHLALKGVYGA
uniref:Uncharacterized protein n=1 Tax=Thermofilum adornatum TaxID=1365176 RepID=A0A7C1CFG5_9CREN